MKSTEAIRRLDLISAAIQALNDPETAVISIELDRGYLQDDRPGVFVSKMPAGLAFKSRLDATHEFCWSVGGEVAHTTCQPISQARRERIAAAIEATR